MHWHVVYADDGFCRVAGRIPFPAYLLPQMRRRSTLEEFNQSARVRPCVCSSCSVCASGTVAWWLHALAPPTVKFRQLNPKRASPQRLFGKQKLPTFTWQLKEDEKLKGAVTRASIARTDFTRSTAYYCLLFPLFRPSRASAADSLCTIRR